MKSLFIFIAAMGLLAVYPLSAADTLPHPILSISSNNGSSANTVTNTWTEAQYTNFFTPRYGPRNEGDGFGSAVVSGDTGWSWSQNNPTNITSTPSGTILPANTNYVIQTQAVTTFTGHTNFAPYYFKSGSTSSKSFVFNVISLHQQGKRDGDLGNLSGAYVNTSLTQANRDNYARRIAIALLDWGRWYPDYTLTGKNSASFINTSPTYILSTDLQRASDHNGLAHEWGDTPLKAFDAIYDSAVLTNMNAEMGFDVRDFITTNIFFCEGDFFVNHVPVQVAIDSNLSGPYEILPEVARVLNRPDYMQWMDDYLTATVTQKVRRDGVLEEGMGYSIAYLTANVNAAINTKNYFLTRPATNSEFIGISNRSVVYAATLQYGQAQWAKMALPNGQLPSFGDTTFNTYWSARNAGNSWVLPAYGTVSMGAGTSSSTAVQVNQNFPGNNNHMRCDTAAFTLWTFANEYLGNIRYYNGAIGRNFGEHIVEKNDVTIDRSNETPFTDADTYGDGNLTIYEPGNSGLALTEVDGFRPYSGKASRFQRLLLLNTVDISKPYIVDVFRVTGGTTHDYTFHGAIRWTQTGQCSFALVTNNNLYPMLEASETWSLASDTPEYGFFRGVSSNTAPGNFQILYTDTNRATARDTKLWMTADPNIYNVYMGWTPVPSRDNSTPTNFFNNLGLTRASTIIRHRVTSGPLSDLFVSVFEPLNAGVTNIASVTRLTMSNSLESCGLKVTFKDGRTDTYIINLRNLKVAGAGGGSASVGTTDGQYALNGRVGMFVDRPTSDPRVWTINATDFKYPNRELSTPTNTYYSGWIAGETRKFTGGAYDAFTTTTPLPTGTALQNKFLSLIHGTLSSGTTNIQEMFKIDQVVASNGLYYVCFTNDHCLEITNSVTSREQVAPQRTFTTSNAFEIALTAFAGQISPIADKNISPGGSSGPIGFTFGNLGTTAATSLQISATSANQTLVPNSNLVFGGSGANRTINITPAVGQTGTSTITISTTDGIWTNSLTFNVVVGTFGLTTSPSSQSVIAGDSVNFTNIVNATNGTGTVTFSVSGLPTGASGNFVPATFTDSGTNVLSITTTSNSTPAGTYPLTITATAGSQSSMNTVTLIVTVPAPSGDVWTGGGAPNGNWSTGANWGGTAPSANDMLFFAGNTQTATTNNLAAGTTFAGIVFNSGAGAFVLNGNGLSLIGDLVNNSSSIQKISLPITLNSSVTFNSGGVLLTNNGVISGSKGFTKMGSGTLGLNAGNTFTGDISVNEGTLCFNFTASTGTSGGLGAAIAPGRTIFVGTNATLIGLKNNWFGNSTLADVNFPSLIADGGTLLSKRYTAIGNVTLNNGAALIVSHSGSDNGNTYADFQFRGTVAVGGSSPSVITNTDGWGNHLGTNTVFNVADVTGDESVDLLVYPQLRNQSGDYASAAGGLTKTGAGTMSLNGTSVYTGSTTISAGAFVVDGTGQLGAGAYAAAITNNGLLVYNSSSPQTLSGVLSGTGDLTLNSSATLTLAADNSYTGDTIVNAGTLALSGGGSISNSGNILLNGSTIDVSGRVNGTLTLNSSQTLKGDGAIIGNAILSGTISPGGDGIVGIITNSGSSTFSAGGCYSMDMADATADAGTGWDFLPISGGLDIQASSANPFVIRLRSQDGDLNDGEPGAANFGNASGQSWIIATASDGVTNFDAGKFSVDSSAFQNDFTGGYFTVATNGNSLLLAFIPGNSQPGGEPPYISSLTISGNSLSIVSTNGSPGSWTLLQSTDLTLPLGQWQTNQIVIFDGNGNLSTNIPNAITNGRMFYILKQ